MDEILETSRLTLRRLNLNDIKFILALVNSPAWIEYIGDRNIRTETQARAYLQNGPLRSYEVNGYGLFLVELKTDQTRIGICGLLRRENLSEPDIGFAFLPEFMGRGYAFEVAEATLVYAKDIFKIPFVLAITLPENKPSIKLLEKLGMKLISSYISPGDTKKLMLFSS